MLPQAADCTEPVALAKESTTLDMASSFQKTIHARCFLTLSLLRQKYTHQ